MADLNDPDWDEEMEITPPPSPPPFRVIPALPSLSSPSSHTSPLPSNAEPPPLPRPGKIKTRFLLISDTHSVPLFPSSDKNHCFRDPLPAADVLLHAGDLSKHGAIDEYQRTLDVIASSNAELKIVIAGNHDISLDHAYCKRMRMIRNVEETVREAKELWTGEKAKAAGIVYLEEGVREFELSNGAKFTIFASPIAPEFCNWAFATHGREDRYNAPTSAFSNKSANHPIPSWPNIDIMLTHGPPYGFLDETQRGPPMSVGCKALRKAVERVRPRMHVFGHIHEGFGSELVDWVDGKAWKFQTRGSEDAKVREKGAIEMNLCGDEEGKEKLKWGEETLMVNAAIMTIRYRPTNPPWIVDLDLPAKDDM